MYRKICTERKKRSDGSGPGTENVLKACATRKISKDEIAQEKKEAGLERKSGA
jgi:hypothetical protein